MNTELLDDVQNTPVEHRGQKLTIKTSVGLAPLLGGDLSESLKVADLNLYSAKRASRAMQ